MSWQETIQSIMDAETENRNLAGRSLLILQEGREIFYHEAGLADVEAGRPVRRDTIFRIFSMTKPITAAAVMLLVDQGRLDLMDPVSRYLPGFGETRVLADGSLGANETPATIRDLLQMTSGLVYPDGDDPASRGIQGVYDRIEALRGTGEELTTGQIARAFGEAPLRFAPGTDWNYGVSADVLGAVVEAASGMAFGDFLEEELFRPLGMKDTAFFVPEEKRERLAAAYRREAGEPPRRYETNYLGIDMKMEKPGFQSGGAGLAGTVDDYARFAEMLRREGEGC